MEEKKKRSLLTVFLIIGLIGIGFYLVIRGILILLSTYSMSGMMDDMKKDSYVTVANRFINATRIEIVNEEFVTPSEGQYIAISVDQFDGIENQSPFNANFDMSKSYIIVLNDGRENLKYFSTFVDEKKIGFPLTEETSLTGNSVELNATEKITPIQELGILKKEDLVTNESLSMENYQKLRVYY